MSKDIIIGTHSIAEAILNSARNQKTLVGTTASIEEFKKAHREIRSVLSTVNIETLSGNHLVQQNAEKDFKNYGFKFTRVPGNVYLICDSMPFEPIGKLFDVLKDSNNKKVLCLDQVTDPQNAAAVLRTASFYGVDAIVIPGKSSSGFSPSFFRIASGAAEHVKVFTVSNLSRFVSRFNELNGVSIGFSEHEETANIKDKTKEKNILLVLGNEEKGISNAVSRQVNYYTSLRSQGRI
jgi:23S rRNA (guanosine2251-2'-O)-methyltransferase